MSTQNLLLCALAILSAPGSLSAAGVATATSAAGTFAARPVSEEYYRVLPANAELKAGDTLTTLPGASLTSSNGAVTLRCLADYDDRSDIPILESAFVLNESKDADLDVTLERGRIEVANAKASGKSTVIVRCAGEIWSIALDTPGTRVAIELSGRWPAGTRFKAGDVTPVLIASLWVLQGTADVKVGGQTLALAAKHHILWDSEAGPRPPELAAKLPDWATAAKPNAAALEAYRAVRAEDPARAIAGFAASDDAIRQRIALVALGANDDVRHLLQYLGEPRNAEDWNFGPSVLRHWLGRGAGQEKKLYDILMANNAFTEAQARIVIQLLFGFNAEDLKQPETFEVLIDYLLHEKPAIRALAAWHLARLVPKEKAVPYKRNATPAEREQMRDAWKKVIPDGQLPPQ